MPRTRRPSGREHLIAGAALETLQDRDRQNAGMRALAALVPGAVAWLAPQRPHAIRLIDLERRARFARPLVEFG